MNIKKLFPLLLLLTSFSFYAQGERIKEKKEQIKALKVAFLTTELNLTASESEKFWPIFNRFDDKQFEIRHQKMVIYISKINNGSLNTMSDKEANILLNQTENADEELFLLRKRYIKDLKEILPAVKILKLRKSEDDFNRKLLHQYRNGNLRKE